MKDPFSRSRTGSPRNRARSSFTALVMRATLVLFCLFILVNHAHAANGEGTIWYFGANAGVDFRSGSPVPIHDGQINQWEGCATIVDANGNLLFYSDGMSVWNRNHAVMENGTGLMGDPSATQSAVVVPRPGSDTIYYLFTVPAEMEQDDGLRFSDVDMSLDGGLGAITASKNIHVTGPISEQVTSLMAAKERDIRVITHMSDSDTFHAFLVTPEGVSADPVVSNVGFNHNDGSRPSQVGYLKSSPGGSRLAFVSYWHDFVEVYRFNTATGAVTDAIMLSGGDYCYGVEFSPDENLLYATYWGNGAGNGAVMQFDLQAGDAAAIGASRVDLSVTDNAWALQLGPDGKIYLATASPYLGVINAPDRQGDACDFEDRVIDLSPGQSSWACQRSFSRSSCLRR